MELGWGKFIDEFIFGEFGGGKKFIFVEPSGGLRLALEHRNNWVSFRGKGEGKGGKGESSVDIFRIA